MAPGTADPAVFLPGFQGHFTGMPQLLLVFRFVPVNSSPRTFSMAKRRSRRSQNAPRGSAPATPASTVRIIGGHFRGRKLQYSGDPRVRPMKDRTREAIFNLLGPISAQQHAVDLFAGNRRVGAGGDQSRRGWSNIDRVSSADVSDRPGECGVVGSRGSSAVDRRQRLLLVAARSTASEHALDCLLFAPYSFYVTRWPELLQSLELLLQRAPSGSLIAVEAETSFDAGKLPDSDTWLVRDYPPARIAVRECT